MGSLKNKEVQALLKCQSKYPSQALGGSFEHGAQCESHLQRGSRPLPLLICQDGRWQHFEFPIRFGGLGPLVLVTYPL